MIANRKEVTQNLAIALQEIGVIEPWWSDEDEMYVFEHQAYPRVLYADPDKVKTRDGYLRALKGFIEERLSGNLSEEAERITPGRGGLRAGAGRPIGSKKPPTERITLPKELADWLKENPTHQEQAKELLPACYSASAVANYFIGKAKETALEITNLKLQKLVYFAQGYFLALKDLRLFNDPILVWQYGPVVKSLYHEFKCFGEGQITQYAQEFDATDLEFQDVFIPSEDAETLLVLEKVWGKYGALDGIELMKITHKEGAPWDQTRKKGRSIIDSDLIRGFFITQLQD